MFITKKQYDKLMNLIEDQDKQLKRATGLLAASFDIIRRQQKTIDQMAASSDIDFPDSYDHKVRDFLKEGGFNS